MRRGALLNRLADLVERDGDQLARLEAIDIGKPVGQPAMLDVPNAVATFRHFAGWADKIQGTTVPTAGYLGGPPTPTLCESRSVSSPPSSPGTHR